MSRPGLLRTWQHLDPGLRTLGVLAAAATMTATPPTVADAAVAELRDRLGDAALVELTAQVALEGFRSRVDVALGLHSQGLRSSCPVG